MSLTHVHYHCPLLDKDKDKDKDKGKILKRPNICYIFEKRRVQGYQIWHLCIISISSVKHQRIISASSVHHRQCVTVPKMLDDTDTNTFSGTKYFRYRYRYFFMVPNFSVPVLRLFSDTKFYRYQFRFFPVLICSDTTKIMKTFWHRYVTLCMQGPCFCTKKTYLDENW